jgi:hypothetical protein
MAHMSHDTLDRIFQFMGASDFNLHEWYTYLKLKAMMYHAEQIKTRSMNTVHSIHEVFVSIYFFFGTSICKYFFLLL